MLYNHPDFLKSLHTGFVDRNHASNKQWRPQLLTNDKRTHQKVLTTLESELLSCEEFWFSVAFLTTSGLAAIQNALAQLRDRNVQGWILTSQYLEFTQPEALRKILLFDNIDLRIATKESFHGKGYLFRRGDSYNFIVGSSNLTGNALSVNKEWNLKVTADQKSEIVQQTIEAFWDAHHRAAVVDEAYLDYYQYIYGRKQRFRLLEIDSAPIRVQIEANSMQKKALENLNNLRKVGQNKALIISATGTGKTYLSAFDAKQFGAKKLLFVVHRRNIAEAAMNSFRSIVDSKLRLGLLSGEEKSVESDFIFTTIQTITREENYSKFEKGYFDYIVVDETHRVEADSYQRIIDYFSPKFLLGMTATPERTDGKDIFKIFNNNVAYEIRLNDALEEDMLCPFHYYGIKDLSVDGLVISDESAFNQLTHSERVRNVIEKSRFYGTDSGVYRSLIFCSRQEECKGLASEFNKLGYRSIALTGDSTEDQRKEAIRRIESDDEHDPLEYIFTVDIFNEGVDIPRINQVIMLRPTQSAIIFIQQMGRGLRKAKDKEYLTIIDFIGNYKNNYLVPIALYGDRSYNKDSLRRLISTGSQFLPGSSTVNFDLKTKEEIYKSIDKANLKTFRDLERDYKLLKFRLGRSPLMCDYLEFGQRDPWTFVEYSGSYYDFVQKVEGQGFEPMSGEAHRVLKSYALEINNGKRAEESLLLKLLLNEDRVHLGFFGEELDKEQIHYNLNEESIGSILGNLNLEFVKMPSDLVVLEDGGFLKTDRLKECLKNQYFVKYLQDSFEYSLRKFKANYRIGSYDSGFVVGQKYSRKDVCRILNWPQNIESTIYGYKTKNGKTPCFVTYQKSHDIGDNTKYLDRFIDQRTFEWASRAKRTLSSPEIQAVINSHLVFLFVKKSDGEGSDFYCLGQVDIDAKSIKETVMPVTNAPVVHFIFNLRHEVDQSLFNYLISD